MDNILSNLPQYHFERGDFCKVFEEVFTFNEIVDIEEMCRDREDWGSFSLFYDEGEFYILHRDSGIMINWYKHLGRTNTCNRPNFSLDDLRVFLKAFKEDVTNG